MSDTMKVHQFTHVDLDGAGCAVVAGCTFPNCLTTRYVDYGNVNAQISEWLDNMGGLARNGQLLLLITDISPTDPGLIDRLNALCVSGAPVRVLCYDHHKTAIELLGGRSSWFHGDTRHCGSALLYDALGKEFIRFRPSMEQLAALDEFVGAVDAYDRWVLDHPLRSRGEDLNRLFWSLGVDEFVRRFTESPLADFDGELRFLSSVLREKERREVRFAVDRQLPRKLYVDELGRKFGILDSGGNPSAIASLYLQEKSEADYVMLVNVAVGKIELRSREGGVDVSDIARKRGGGGGHQAAAGFLLSLADALEVILSRKE